MKFQFLDKVGAVGALLITPSCPACFPFIAAIGSAVGLGFLRPYEGILVYAFQALVLIALIGNLLAYRKHKKLIPLIVGIVSPGLILFAFYIYFIEPIIYLGLFGMILAGLLNFIENRKCKACLPRSETRYS